MTATSASSVGHLLSALAFASIVACGVSALCCIRQPTKAWQLYVRTFYGLHVLSVLGVFCTLCVLVLQDSFAHHYIWRHSATHLSIGYKISSLWEGQEGSFLLWIFWNALVGLLFLYRKDPWKYQLMALMALIQAFISSMILGSVVGGVKIGLSPFLLTKDVLDLPIYRNNPNFVPTEGNGLNLLLQNYWMVIHPPTLFLGFSLSALPFCYALTALWKKTYRKWIQHALPWTILSILVLGVGILMGAYWAYETLNFGGYWSWDPVENAVYIPWLLLVATLHAMLMARKRVENGTKSVLVLCIVSFLSVLYATFLVRSGILGNTSVHSFTDAGLSHSILLFLASCSLLSVLLLLNRWRGLPGRKSSTLSPRDSNFWLFMGISTLFLASFQVFIATSIPVYNVLSSLFGQPSHAAPPADPVSFYTTFQLYFACAVLFFSGVAQFFWWKKKAPKPLGSLLKGGSSVLVATSIIIFFVDFNHFSHIILLFCGLFSLFSNGYFLYGLAGKNWKICGGLIAHLGVALLVLGILFSSGFSSIISLNNTGFVWSKDFPEEINQKNILLFEDEPREMKGFSLHYRGRRAKIKGMPGYTRLSHLAPTERVGYYRTKIPLHHQGKLYHKSHEVVRLEEIKKTYFEIEYAPKNGRRRIFSPSVSVDEDNETVVYSPDIIHTPLKDLYAHVRTFPDPGKISWTEQEERKVAVGAFFFVNDYAAVLERIVPLNNLKDHNIGDYQAAVKGVIKIMGRDQEYIAEPIFLVKEDEVAYLPDTVESLAARLTLRNIYPDEELFLIGIETTQKPWIILEIAEKPLINLLWLGAGVLCLGLMCSAVARWQALRGAST